VSLDYRPLVLCMVGTDHHPFARLVAWCDTLAAARHDVDVVVQYGLSRPPEVAHGRDFLDHDELGSLLGRARVAISHGGPGSVSDIRAAGLHPIAVPRDPARGEHVDGHQIRFLDRMAKDGLVDLITSREPFLNLLDWRLDQPVLSQVDRVVDEARVLATVDTFARLVNGLFDSPPPAQDLRDARRPEIHQA
jgi:UDP-N-acetylglucosamine transferase subunit ALG13